MEASKIYTSSQIAQALANIQEYAEMNREHAGYFDAVIVCGEQLFDICVINALYQFGHEHIMGDMSHLLLLGKFGCGGGPIFKVVLEC